MVRLRRHKQHVGTYQKPQLPGSTGRVSLEETVPSVHPSATPRKPESSGTSHTKDSRKASSSKAGNQGIGGSEGTRRGGPRGPRKKRQTCFRGTAYPEASQAFFERTHSEQRDERDKSRKHARECPWHREHERAGRSAASIRTASAIRSFSFLCAMGDIFQE